SKVPTFTGVVRGDDVTDLVQAFASKNVLGADGSSLVVTGYIIDDGNNGANYDVRTSTAKGTISAADLTVSANAQSKILGTTDPPLTYQVTAGTVFQGDSFTGALTREPGESLGSYPILQGTLSAGPNYDLKYIGANLNILTITLASSLPVSAQGQSV